MPRQKPSIFVGSSTEKSKVVEQLVTALRHYADLVPWWMADSFRPMTSTLDGLFKAARTFDFGIFVLTPDDETDSRGQSFFTMRDNTLFEFGLFLGTLGEKRTFAIVEDSPDRPVKTPTDLLGIQIERFSYDSDKSLAASLTSFAGRVGRCIEEVGPRNFNLARKWDFICDRREFEVELDPERMKHHADRIRGQRLLVAYRRRNPGVFRDEDPNVVIGSSRRVDPSVDQHVLLRAGGLDFPEIKSGETVDGYVFLLPARADISGCRTIGQLRDEGCLILDRDFGLDIK